MRASSPIQSDDEGETGETSPKKIESGCESPNTDIVQRSKSMYNERSLDGVVSENKDSNIQSLLIKNIHQDLGVPQTDINNVVSRARCLSQNPAENDV